MDLNSLRIDSYSREKWQNLKKDNQSKIFITIFLFLIFCFIILFTYFIFREKIFKKERSVRLNFEIPEEIPIGYQFDFKIKVLNQEKNNLVNPELSINLPENFYLLDSEPKCLERFFFGCLINLPQLKKDEETEIKINGVIFGSPGERKKITASLIFQLENFSSWFKKENSQEIFLTPALFDLEIEGNNELMISEEGEFRMIAKNISDKPVKAKIIFFLPEDFTFTFLSPEGRKEEKNIIWEFDFKENETKSIDFKGYFSKKEESKNFIFQAGFIDPEGKFFSLKELKHSIKISQPGLVLGLRINDSFLEEQFVNFGEKIKFSLTYKNISQEKFFDLVIKIGLTNSEFLDLENFPSFWRYQSGEKEMSGNQWKIETKEGIKYLWWDKSQIKDLETIEPTNEGEITFFFNLKTYEEISRLKPINPFVNFSSRIEANLFRHQLIAFQVESNEIKLKINSHLKLNSEARYFNEEGLKIGSGPIPPKVGETTTYFIFLRPINTVNEIKNIRISASLPEKISWSNQEKSSVGNLSFDESSKKIIWQIDSLPAYSGGPYSFVEASFKVSLTPTELDRGQILNLLEDILFEAEDVFTGAKIYSQGKSLDTNLEFDDWGKGKGKVE
ncbi:MAG: hypothetical protein ACK413_02595 [Patescibacteria group bacterium]